MCLCVYVFVSLCECMCARVCLCQFLSVFLSRSFSLTFSLLLTPSHITSILHTYIFQGGALLLYLVSDKLILKKSVSVPPTVSVLTNNIVSENTGVLSKKEKVLIQPTVMKVKESVKEKEGVKERESVPQVLNRISRDKRFWLMLIGKVALMTVGQFISFIPLYLNTGKEKLE